MKLDFSSALNWDNTTFSGEVIVSLIVMICICIFSFVIYFVFKGKDPTKPDKNGFIAICVAGVEKLQDFTTEIMGKKYLNFSGYVLAVGMYIFFSFMFGTTGLPNPLTSLVCPLSIGLVTFVMIHLNAMKANKWKYFTRFIDPIPIFLPINLISMWAPLLSLSLRLFGNALSGYCLMTLVYFYLEKLSAAIFSFIPSGVNSIFIAPLITPWLHLYFDLFSSLIQTLVFCILTMIWVSQENPDEEEENEIFLKTA